MWVALHALDSAGIDVHELWKQREHSEMAVGVHMDFRGSKIP